MQLKPEDIGFTRDAIEDVFNVLIQRYGYNKNLVYTMPPSLAEQLEHIGRLVTSDINAILNAPADAVFSLKDSNNV